LLFTASVLSLTLSSCALFGWGASDRAALKAFTEENGAFPSDYGKDQSQVLLFITKDNDSKYNDNLKRIVSANCKSPYKYASENSFDSEFSDTDKYRYYLFYEDGRKVEYKEQSTGMTTRTSYLKQFFLQDRKENKKYNCKKDFGKWGAALRAYIKNLDKKRASFE
jgi:hypothetical protein